MIDISKYNKADVLRVLYNNAEPQGMGFIRYEPADMSLEEATEYINGKPVPNQTSTSITYSIKPGGNYVVAFVLKDPSTGEPKQLLNLGQFFAEYTNINTLSKGQKINRLIALQYTENSAVLQASCRLDTDGDTQADCLTPVDSGSVNSILNSLKTADADQDDIPDLSDPAPNDKREIGYFPFGITSHLQWYSNSKVKTQIGWMKGLGVRFTRFGIQEYSASEIKAKLKLTDEANIKTIANIARGSHVPSEFAEEARQYVNSYKDLVRLYAVWNEPNLKDFFKIDPDPHLYYRIFRAAYFAVKEADPSAIVLLAPVSIRNKYPFPDRYDAIKWQRIVVEDDSAHPDGPVINNPDVYIAFHDYTDPRIKYGGWPQAKARLQEILNIFPDKPVIITEFLFQRQYGVTQKMRAEALAEFVDGYMKFDQMWALAPHTLIGTEGDDYELTMGFVKKDGTKTKEYLRYKQIIADFEALEVDGKPQPPQNVRVSKP